MTDDLQREIERLRSLATQHHQGGDAFEDLLDQYFDIGVREGREKRDHDDMVGSAELTRAKIRAAFNADRKYPAALAQQPLSVQEGWRPIETAPKDGTYIDLWMVNEKNEGRRMPGAYWDKAVQKFWPLGGWQAPGLDYDGGYDYCERHPHADITGRVTFELATHWMPMPDGPTLGGEQG